MLRRLKHALTDLAFRWGWVRGHVIIKPDLFDHNVFNHDDVRPRTGRWSAGSGTCPLGEPIMAAYFDGQYYQPYTPFRVCGLGQAPAEWLAAHDVIHRIPLDLTDRHRIIFARRADLAMFMLRFEGVTNEP